MAFNRSGATQVAALDISKAFDRFWHAGLLHKLKFYGISGQIFGHISIFSVIDGFGWFFSICLCKNNAEAVKFLGILKNTSPSKKNMFKKEKKCFLLNKKVVFVFHTILQLDCITQFMYCIIHWCLYSLFILLLFFCISFLETEHRKNTNPPSLYKWQKFIKMNEKRSLSYQSMCAECVTGQINSLILQLFLRRFYRLIFALSQKS